MSPRFWISARQFQWRAHDSSEGFLEKAKERFADGVVLHRGSAAEIPLADRTVDATVSGLVLNFVPDGCAALAEMARVTVRGGTVGAYVWDYAEGMELIRLFWDAAVELDPEAAMLDEGARFPLCRPEPLSSSRAPDFGESRERPGNPNAIFGLCGFWRPFLGGQGPAPRTPMALDEEARARLRERIRRRVPLKADGSISLTARAWAVRVTVEG